MVIVTGTWPVHTQSLHQRILTSKVNLLFKVACYYDTFLRATAGTAIARLSHRNSVCLSVTRVDQAKTVQASIIKSSPLAAPKTLVSGSVTLFQNFHRGYPN